MITVTKVFKFCYAHQLHNYDGKCANLHGHNGRLEVEVSNDQFGSLTDERKNLLNDEYPGMVIDFSKLKEVVNDVVISAFDHSLVNKIIAIPTAEWMVAFAVGELVNHLPEVLTLERVRLYEEDDSWAEWRRDVSS
jgi:6-pyruvoyltetrahydropterin/6-carboxytetrahydropterin synthase